MGLLSKIKKTVRKVKTGVSSACKTVKNGVSTACNKVKTGVTKGATGVKNFVSDGYLASGIKGAITGFASGGFAGAIVGAGAGMASQKLSSMAKGNELPEGDSVDLGDIQKADGTNYDLSTVAGVNAYFKLNGQDLVVDSNGIVKDSSGSVVGVYNFSTYELLPPTENAKKAASGAGSWKDSYNLCTTSYWGAK